MSVETLGKMTPLRLLCIRHGTTRAQVAESAGLSLRTMYNIESGDPIATSTVEKIAAVLGEDSAFVADVLSGKVKLELDFQVRVAA